MKIFLFFLLLPLLMPSNAIAQNSSPPSFPISESFQGSSRIGLHLAIYEDPTANQTLEEVMQQPFFPSQELIPNFGMTRSAFWSKFTLHNESDQTIDLILVHQYVQTDYVELFIQDGQDFKKIDNGDLHTNKSNETIEYIRPAFKIKVQPGAHTFYLRVASRGVVQLDFSLWPEQQFYQYTTREYLFLAFFLGILSIMAVYNLFLYFVIRDSSYLFYVAFTISYGLTSIVILGLGNIFFPEYPFLNNEMYIILTGLIYVTCIQFSSTYLDLKSRHKILHGIGIFLAIWGLVGSSVGFFSYEIGARLVISLSFVMPIYLIIIGYYLLFKGNKNAYFFSLAWTFFLIFSLYRMSGMYGFVEKNLLTEYGQNIGSIVELVILSLGVGDKIRRSKQAAKRREQKLHSQLKEEHEKVIVLNASLEQKVIERTKDIKAILQSIELGIFTIDQERKIAPEYSDFMNQIFGEEQLVGRDPIEMFYGNRTDSDQADQDRNALDCILGEDELNFMVNRETLSKEIILHKGDERKILALSWGSILKGHIVDRLIITVNDVTAQRAIEQEIAVRNEEMSMVVELVAHPKEVTRRFFQNARMLIEQSHNIVREMKQANLESLKILFINAHTLKGLARSLNLSFLKDLVHRQESVLGLVKENHASWDQNHAMQALHKIQRIFDKYKYVNDSVLGRSTELLNHAEIEYEEISKLLNLVDGALSEQASSKDVMFAIKSILIRKMYSRGFDVIQENMKSVKLLAKDLQKEEPDIVIHDNEILVSEQGKEILSNVFIHLIRNSMDHGIEIPSMRLEKGKARKGQLVVEMFAKKDWVQVDFFDDGKGLDINMIREIGYIKGLIAEHGSYSTNEIANIIFESGFSTASKLSDISGRGIGMDAVRKFVEKSGGNISIILDESKSADFCHPFKVRMLLPHHYFFMEHGHDRSASLLEKVS